MICFNTKIACELNFPKNLMYNTMKKPENIKINMNST